jgi:hypothetical protein
MFLWPFGCATNASRTALYDIHAGRWDEDLCRLFRVPMALLPDVRDCVADFGATTPDILGAPVAIRGVAGDQQAAAIGQACFAPGMMKATYGTGGFALLNTGATAVASKSRLLTTVAWRLDGKPTYALEGAIFIAGAAVQWLRDGLGLIARADETGALAEAADPAQAVYLVPAFTGLGAPWWDAEARGALFGLTRATTRAELARAALECVGYQTADLLDAMRGDWGGGRGNGSARRRRHDGLRLDHAVSRRHSRCAGGPPGQSRNDRRRRRLARGPRRRPDAAGGCFHARLGARPTLRPAHGRHRTREQTRRLARRCAANAVVGKKNAGAGCSGVLLMGVRVIASDVASARSRRLSGSWR